MKISMKYGEKHFDLNFEHKNVKIISSLSSPKLKREEEILKYAIENPIDSPRLKDIVKPDEDVCIIVPDVTRLWQKTICIFALCD